MEFWLRDRKGKRVPEVILCPESAEEECYLRRLFTLVLYNISAYHELHGEDESYYPLSDLIREPVDEDTAYTPEDSPYCLPSRLILKQYLRAMSASIAEIEADIETRIPPDILHSYRTLLDVERFDMLRATHQSVIRQLREKGYFLTTTETGVGTSFTQALTKAMQRWTSEPAGDTEGRKETTE